MPVRVCLELEYNNTEKHSRLGGEGREGGLVIKTWRMNTERIKGESQVTNIFSLRSP